MIGQRQADAVAQRFFRNFRGAVEQDAPIAAVFHLCRIKLAERLDQIGLTVEVHRDPVIIRLHAVDPDRAAAARLGGEIAGLVPLQRLLQRPDAVDRLGGLEDDLAKHLQFRADIRRIGGKDLGDAVVLESALRFSLHRKSSVILGLRLRQ